MSPGTFGPNDANKLLDPQDRPTVIKSCKTCAHIGGPFGDRCSRVEKYCSTEMAHGTICGPSLKEWVQRPGILTRIWRFFI